MFLGSNIPQERRHKAYQHRTRMNLVQTSTWLDLDEVTEVKGAILDSFPFAAAAGGDAEWVAMKTEQVRKKSFRARWGGEYVQTESEEAVYRWVKHLAWERVERVLVWNSMQAGLAGGCPACIERLFEAGGNLSGTWDWVSQLALNTPRWEATVATLEVCLQRQQLSDRIIAARGWLQRAEEWVRQQARQKCSEEEWGGWFKSIENYTKSRGTTTSPSTSHPPC